MHNFSKLLIFVAIFAGAGCASQKPQVQARSTVSTTLEVARRAYHDGMNSMKEGDFDAAFKSFSLASRAPSHVVYSRLARLRLADTLYYQNMFEEASKAYVAFINTNTSNPNLHYAYFRLADSKVQSISGDFFLVPPSDRRDQKPVRSALKSIQSFVANFPDSPYCSQVLKMRRRMVDIVSSFEMEVARFNMTRKKPEGALLRIEQLMKDIPSTRDSDKVRYAYIGALAAAGRHEMAVRESTDYLDRFTTARNRDDVQKIMAGSRTAIQKAAEAEKARQEKEAAEAARAAGPAGEPKPADDAKPGDGGEPADDQAK
ncbi:MAG TPA: outer membrane protein assembly factor BamD [Myxococcota bacterium]|nr:outer membrane protein assembly factor BamD [Myxococcota bacterium]